MHDDLGGRQVDRRKLLRRGATVVAGVAGAGVAGTVIASPAQAAPGGNMIIGQANDAATSQTSLAASNANLPTLSLNNSAVDGPALRIVPTPGGPISAHGPAGSFCTDEWGDLYGVGDIGTGAFGTKIYSTTFATMPIPTAPFRILDTLVTTPTATNLGRDLVVPGSADFDAQGRIIPKNSTTVPDLILDLTSILNPGGYAAVQGAIQAQLASVLGWVAVWDEGDHPGTSVINYQVNQSAATFTQSLVGLDGMVRFKVKTNVRVLFDLSGFILVDPFVQFATPSGALARTSLGRTTQRFQKRVPGK